MAYILIIDDNEEFRDLLQRFLGEQGYETAAAPDGREGIKQYLARPADLVITDILMPEKEGIETIRDLRRKFPQVKIIAVSGGGRIGPDSYLKMAKGVGALRTLKKPVNRTVLLETVE